jgi:hypothetical protein
VTSTPTAIAPAIHLPFRTSALAQSLGSEQCGHASIKAIQNTATSSANSRSARTPELYAVPEGRRSYVRRQPTELAAHSHRLRDLFARPAATAEDERDACDREERQQQQQC